ncbi:xanthine dehydrogenase family protein molybdopterin-binding subunit [Ornithinimicrobium panacihumi]|uniref:xanthine dehydrogenase family protein molybdopterin-binding subunit n=1 Tax=Ornithinimicrobium panacihumi TaxID=2008449 RepID=UPI003F897819
MSEHDQELLTARAIGTDPTRVEGPDKVRGRVPYAYEHPVEDPLYLFPVQAEIALGRVVEIDTEAAEKLDEVLMVLTHENAPPLADTEDKELAVLRDGTVGFRGQYLGAVVAQTPEAAREGAGLVEVSYEQDDHDADFRPDHRGRREPEEGEDDVDTGDVEAQLEQAEVVVDATYRTPVEHNNPMEPHTTIALWDGQTLTLWMSSQGVHPARKELAPVLGLERDQVRIISPHVGGGFGSKGVPHADLVLTALAAIACEGRPVKYAVTRQQMFAITGYRAATEQRVRLGARADGTLTALAFESVAMSSRTKEFPETASSPARMMYAAPSRLITQRLVPLDVPVPSWMRAPGEAPGMVAMEIAMDELAVATGVDPIEVRVRNEPEVDPDTGLPFNRRRLVDCLREGAERFGWRDRDPAPRTRRERGWLVGTGVASATYPANRQPFSQARVHFTGERYDVSIAAADLGTGTWTVLAQIAADALEVPVDQVRMQIGDSDLPRATVAGGSTGLASWGAAVVAAAQAFRAQHGVDPAAGDSAEGTAGKNPAAEKLSMHSFGAHFAQVRVHEGTGEIRVDRMLGVFSAGRVVNPRTARSQLIGGITMGIGMALHEKSELDPRFGHVVNRDLAGYHIPTHADVPQIDVHWLDEDDPSMGPVGARGMGEIGIVGAAAAIANAAHHATGVRVRDIPVLADAFLGG